ncbi:helix-turn-helix transcriptional regulator [Baekduia alba]|uniref:helix-turn-helix transcriptional regulator n=1 Tax=Baekduia alba TaxID=2997333 RepID=UPI002341D36F|nr:helix-turn-helix transcriptional regulator [Baekduia alba]
MGRATECARIDRLLAGARLGTSGVLVLAGDPGVGKTALLEHALATADGMAVLRAQGVEPEVDVPFGGLLALLRPALGHLDEIPGPQAAALRTALALEPGGERDRFTIGAATLSLLAAHAERRPVLVVVDDAHWLDAPSLAAITFAAGRLLADAVAVLVAARPELAPTSLPTLPVAGLDRAAAAAVLEHRAGRPLPPGAADRVYDLTLGNPLALVELADADAAADVGAEPPLPIETTVERAFARRIAELPEPARRTLLLAAAEGSGDLAVLQRAAPALDVELTALDAAERAGLTTSTPGTVAFVHPLARSAAYRSAAPDERRAAHRALAAVPGDPDRRAAHLAAAAVGPDADAARALEAAARRARARSGYAAAASSFERAARLTVGGPERARLLFAAADAAWLGGQAERVDRLLDDAREAGPDPALALEVDHLRGHAALRSGRVVEAHDILTAAAATDPGRAVVMLAEAADACAYAARPGPMLAAAQGAWDAVGPDAGERERFFASLALGMAYIYNGRGEEGARRVRAAVEILERSDLLSDDPRVLAAAALGPLWLREQAQGRALVARAMAAARDAGAVGALPFSLWLAARDAATSDRWAVAEALYEEAIRLARETGQATSLTAALAGLACVHARQGREQDCRAHAAEALDLTARLGLDFFALWALDALAELELGLGNIDAAVARLEEKERLLVRRGVEDPDVSPVPELVEALIRLDRIDEARERLAQYTRRADAKRQPWALARLARCSGLLDDDGNAGFAEALRLHAQTPDRFEEARTRLCHGERLRRDRRRADARPELRRALEMFDALGAAPWAERARLELLATGETARRRDPSTLDQLTPRELQVALVLAEGHTIREAAAKLFLSPKTVDYHLRHVYRKLGIRSRDALPAALAGPGDASQEGHLMRGGEAAPTVAAPHPPGGQAA